ncbi:hypothetical protein GDH07_07730 [Pseudomonas sp. MC042]|uniref:Uncharacterized protein n=1 Tax=Pseudomonas piscis TaxID=2614538 RepID=U6ZSG2_9PSED|nr:hypothetical protein P308_09590 [Pseudomonas piscis]ERO61402.1 hypothetical protein P308_09500 [Pseudomonas piscis]MQA53214.1 hypothetical protein [Pseudomonas piscis]
MRSLAYIEDNGDEFPINNLVRCGQAAFEAKAEPSANVVRKKSAVTSVASNTMFFPRALPKNKRS